MNPTGYLEPTITDADYVLGVSPLAQIPLQPDGQWTAFLPDVELQARQIETYNCTGFNTLNCLEMIGKRLGKDNNYSDRFLGLSAGTYPPGNDPNTVAQAIRHNGCIPESMLPFSESLSNIDEYYSFKGGLENVCNWQGMQWLKVWDIGHEWVSPNSIAMMKALQYSPLGVSVNAWERQGNVYIRNGEDNHWTTIVGYQENKYWICYDSYIADGSPLKLLAWDYGFKYIKRYHLEEKVTQEQLTIFRKILEAMSAWLKEIMK